MQADCYFGTYARFNTASKKEAATLLGADNLVGDVFEIEFRTTEAQPTIAWMKNRFGTCIGYFDQEFSRELRILDARGWKLQALLSFIAYSDSPDPGHYWGQAAVICYDKKFEHQFGVFQNTVAQKLMEGNRPELELTQQHIEQVIISDGSWVPKKTVPLPPKERGTVIMKSRRKMSEKLIEQGRKGNKGCYVVSWAFLLLVVALAIFGLKSCGAF